MGWEKQRRWWTVVLILLQIRERCLSRPSRSYEAQGNINTKINGGGQECPPHMGQKQVPHQA
jgi:hypothetical protein